MAKQKNAYVTFTHTLIVHDVEGMTEDQIKQEAADYFNELPLDDIYKSSEDVISVDIQEEEESY